MVGGCFKMGDAFGDDNSDEKPVHEACVNDFYMGEHEVTQREWKKIMGKNPSEFNYCGDDCPVENVSWSDVQEYINKLNEHTRMNYRLPTEVEWEYAARGGGKKERWAGTNDKSALGKYAWYDGNSGSKTHSVKTKKPNVFGLYDMTGNVWEWVSDWYGSSYYKNSVRNNPNGPSTGTFRVLRGGGWYIKPSDLRASVRYYANPDFRYFDIGFRLAMTP